MEGCSKLKKRTADTNLTSKPLVEVPVKVVLTMPNGNHGTDSQSVLGIEEDIALLLL